MADADDTPKQAQGLTHVDASGQARMVDVGGKQLSRRTATASAQCHMNLRTADAIRANSVQKGDVLQAARLAGIMAAKRTDELIPLCHSLPLECVSLDFTWESDSCLRIQAASVTTGKTGVEMESLVAATVAALTIYDMCKSMDREMQITNVVLDQKSGGVRGDFLRSERS